MSTNVSAKYIEIITNECGEIGETALSIRALL